MVDPPIYSTRTYSEWYGCLCRHQMRWEREREREIKGGKVEGRDSKARSTEPRATGHTGWRGENGEQTTDNRRMQRRADTQTLTVTLGPSSRLTPHASCAALRSALKHL